MLQLNNQFETGSQQNILEEDFFFENALDLFCVLDVSGRFIRLNKQWNKLLGWVVEDMLECSIVEFVHPDDVDYVNLMIENASLSTVSNAENRIISKSGEIFWISWRLVVHPDSGNIFGVGREITKEKHNIQKLEEEGRRYNLAMRAADTGIWDWLIPQNKIHYSGAWKMQLGYEKDELIESFETWQILLHPDDYERVIKAFGDYLSHPSSIFEIEYRLRHKDGTYRWIHNRAASLIGKDGKPYRMLGAHQDITEQKIFENELLEARRKVEVASIYKNNFLANMSHEIRTPMNGIVGFAELLKDSNISFEEKNQYSKIITDNCMVLLNLVDDIVDASKIEANELGLQLNSFSLKDLFHELHRFYKTYKTKINKDNVKLKVTVPDVKHNDFIETDHYRLKQILMNIIDNALKFTKEGFVEFGYTLVNDNFVQFYVKDTGTGIPMDKINHVFGSFHQSDESFTRRFGGIGLGLTISEGLVNLLKGKIWVESEENYGSIFNFTIPYQPVSELITDFPDIKIQKEMDIDLSGIDILIAEDVHDNYLYIAEVLKNTQANVKWARDGNEAIDLLKTGRFKMVFLDLIMPGKNGFEVLEFIMEEYPETIVIGQSAYFNHDSKENLFKEKCLDCLIKPIMPEEILGVVSKYL